MNQVIKEPKVKHYTVSPYSARALILKLEQDHNITIRAYESTHHLMICIDKEEKKDV